MTLEVCHERKRRGGQCYSADYDVGDLRKLTSVSSGMEDTDDKWGPYIFPETTPYAAAPQAFGVWKRLPRPAFPFNELQNFKAKTLAVIDALRRRDSYAAVEAGFRIELSG